MTIELLLGAVCFAAAFVGAWGMRGVSDRTRVAFDLVFFCAASAFLWVEEISPLLNTVAVTTRAEDLLLRVIAAAWWLLCARLIVGLLGLTLHRDRHSREARLFSDLLAGTIYLVVVFIVLSSVFALPIRGLFATSGILAVVLGFALQNTLADVFSGIAVGIEAPFQVDDRIMINDKIEGQVIQVNWRSIRILTDLNDVAIFPNSLVAKAEIVNRSFPSSRRAGAVAISCSKDAAPERVSEALLQAALLCPSIERTPPTAVRLAEMKRRKSIYKVFFWVADSHAFISAESELVQRCRQQLHFAGLLASKDEATKTRPSDAEILGGLVLFEALSVAEVDQLAGALNSRILRPAEVLFNEGVEDATLYIVASGVVEIARTISGGGREIIACIGSGEFVGDIALLTGAPHVAKATALTRTRVLQLSKSAIDPLLKANPGLAAAFDDSIQHCREILKSSVATHEDMHTSTAAQLLERIRSFFGPPVKRV